MPDQHQAVSSSDGAAAGPARPPSTRAPASARRQAPRTARAGTGRPGPPSAPRPATEAPPAGGAYADHLDFYRRGPYAPFLREHRSAGSAPVRMLDLHQPAGDYAYPAAPEFLLKVNRHRARFARLDMGNGRRWRGWLEPGDMLLSAPGEAAAAAADTAHAFSVVAIPAVAVRPLLRGAADFGPLHAAPFRSPLVEALCRQLWDEAAEEGGGGAPFADGALLVLASALLRLPPPPGPAPPPGGAGPKGGLAPFRLRRALDCMERRLGEGVSIADLAAAAGLSPRHFATAFRAATGAAPHRYLVGRRVERAKELLAADPRRSVTAVALAVGFGSSAHFATTFRKLAGTTPSAWQRRNAA